MVVATILHQHVQPGRDLFKRIAEQKKLRQNESPPDLSPEELSSDGLLRELWELTEARTAHREVQSRCYSARDSLDEPVTPDEELTWFGDKVVWSKGSAIHRTFTFDEDGIEGEVTQALFAWFIPPHVSEAPVASTSNLAAPPLVDHKRLFGPFASPGPAAWTDEHRFGRKPDRIEETAKDPQQAVCIFLRNVLFIHFPKTGRDYYVHLPFRVRKAWALKTGLFVERIPESDELDPTLTLAIFYSLSDPLDEFRVVAQTSACISPNVPDHRASCTTVGSPLEHVLLVARRPNEPPYIVTLDAATHTFHVYAYIFVSENELKRDGPTLPLPGVDLHARDGKGKGRTRSSMPGIASPTGLPERTRAAKVSLGPQAENYGIGKQVRDEGRVSAARTSLAGAFLDRMGLGGELERDMLSSRRASGGEDFVEAQIMRSEVYIAKVAEGPLASIAAEQQPPPGDDVKACLFDARPPTCILALHTRRTGTLHLLWLDSTRAAGLCARRSEITPIKAISPVLATRPDIRDLLVMDATSSMTLLTADCYSISIDSIYEDTSGFRQEPPTPQCDPVAWTHISSDLDDCVTLHLDPSRQTSSLSTSCRISLKQTDSDALVQCCFRALSCVLSTSSFLRVLTSYLDQQNAAEFWKSRWDVFSTVVLALFAGQVTTEPSDPLDLLLSQRSHDAVFNFVQRTSVPLHTTSVSLSDEPPLGEKHAAFVAIHLIAEDYKLVTARSREVASLLLLLAPWAAALSLAEWVDYYHRSGLTNALNSIANPLTLPSLPFDIVSTLCDLLAGREATYPDLRQLDGVVNSRFYGTADPAQLSRQLLDIFTLFRTAELPRSSAVVLAIQDLGWTIQDVETLSLGVRTPLLEAIRQAQMSAPTGWPLKAYELIDRDDLARTTVEPSRQIPKRKPPNVFRDLLQKPQAMSESAANTNGTAQIPPASQAASGADELRQLLKAHSIASPSSEAIRPEAQAFSQDLRLEEVARMLQSWNPLTIRMPERPDLGEHALAAEQQAFAVHVASRTLALLVGSAMFTFRSELRKPTETFRVHTINLTVKVLPQGMTVTPDHVAISFEKRHWPEFHSGVGAALRIASEPGTIDFSDIAFNKPDNLDARFAGLLMGLGMSGHVRSMASYQAFAYLDPKHEYTSIGLLLGLAASFVSTCDPKVTSVLSVHLSALHPSESTSLNVSRAIQAAGMLSLGLLYLGTNRRRMADICVRELSNTKVVPLEGPDTCREAYTLSLGFAYGMIMLGAGKDASTAPSDHTVRTLRGLVTGERMHDLPSTKNSMSNATDVALTSPAATVALALVFYDSGRSDIANMLEIPLAPEHFDYVRPDLILLRVLARCLILRETISPSKGWVESLVPTFILKAKAKGHGGRAGSMDIDLAYWCIVAGGLMAMALRYAGTADGQVHGIMIAYLDAVQRFGQLKDPTIQGRFLRRGVRSCSNIVCLALATVMAGTGELHVLRRLRQLHGQIGDQWDYGTHMATHMAIGLLFLGGGAYTLSSSPAATALLLCALYPAFPTHAGDNRSHIQAARHLWVLAAEPRRLIARDVDTNEKVFLPVRIRVREEGSLRSQKLVTPTLIPDISTIESIRVDSPRYMNHRISLSGDDDVRDNFLRTRTIFVKRCGGYLDYAQDPKGVRSLYSRSRADAGAHVFDFGKVAEIVAMQRRRIGGDESTLEDSLEPFATDDTMRGAVKYLCRPEAPESARFEAFASSVIMESLSNDKPNAFGLYLGFLLAHKVSAHGIKGALARRELQMAVDFYASGWLNECLPRVGTGARHQDLIGAALIAHVILLLHPEVTDSVRPFLLSYLRTGAWPDAAEEKAQLAYILSTTRMPNVDVVGQLANILDREKQQGKSVGERMVMLRLVLRTLMGGTPEEPMVAAMGEAWL